VGISVAHSSYHKHSAYIIANADMPGFSRRDQARLSRLVLAHRGKLERAQPLRGEAPEWTLIFCLRTAVLLHRSRDDQPLPELTVGFTRSGFQLKAGAGGLDALPLTAAALEDEAQQWAGSGGELRIIRGA
jgi:exopolyphosphatase/guanosine-5'-triphosphate,3'-diphosphate pyrophosphatase